MQIQLTPEQYKELILSIGLANSILGLLGDVDEEYKEKSLENDELEKYLLSFAKDFDAQELAEEFNGQIMMSDEYYENTVTPIIEEYDDSQLWDNLANLLAWRDFRKNYTKEEIQNMAKKNNGYFGVEIFDYESKYWDEFNEFGIDRLEIIK